MTNQAPKYNARLSRFHPHNVAAREAQRIAAQDRAHKRRAEREAEAAKAQAMAVAALASPEMLARRLAAQAEAALMVERMAAARPCRVLPAARPR